MKDEVSDMWVLDSVANNANEHFLHIMFFLLGETYDSSAMPYASHAVVREQTLLCFEFEDAIVEYDAEDGHFTLWKIL
ncbi:hypothetical protein [Paenibacillus periandrae]|uniref:hypothetical protein n=1 Tax=Paenibacillus periandrae TaxID=1761741 RepID=UPI001F08F636|nr:hypothetical protein [Paenibacillus periandrae]